MLPIGPSDGSEPSDTRGIGRSPDHVEARSDIPELAHRADHYRSRMRTTRRVFIVLAWPLLLGGLAMTVIALLNTDDPGLLLGVGIAGASLLITGVVFLAVVRYLGNFVGGSALDEPVPGSALVRTVTDTGTTINHVNAVFRVGALITVDGRAPYDGEFRIVVGRAQWGLVQPGMTLPVLVERNDPDRIVHDPDRPAMPPSGTVPTATTTMRADDVIARGVPTQGLLLAADPLGMTAGQLVDTLPPHEADDVLMRISLTYVPAGGTEQRTEFVARVPDGKAHWLQPGETLPIVHLPDDVSTATIDWSRL